MEEMDQLAEAPDEIKRICLVIDDEDGIRRFLFHMLHKLGIGACGCRDVKGMIESTPYDACGLVFLDLALQGSDAIEAIKGLEERRFRGAVQLISGRGSVLLNEIKRIGEQHGLRMLQPLEKPFRLAAIDSVVRQEWLLEQAARSQI